MTGTRQLSIEVTHSCSTRTCSLILSVVLATSKVSAGRVASLDVSELVRVLKIEDSEELKTHFKSNPAVKNFSSSDAKIIQRTFESVLARSKLVLSSTHISWHNALTPGRFMLSTSTEGVGKNALINLLGYAIVYRSWSFFSCYVVSLTCN